MSFVETCFQKPYSESVSLLPTTVLYNVYTICIAMPSVQDIQYGLTSYYLPESHCCFSSKFVAFVPFTAHATLTFETELLAVQRPSIPFNLVGTLQLLAWPAAGCLLIYYLYERYQKAPTKKELREERRSRKKKH